MCVHTKAYLSQLVFSELNVGFQQALLSGHLLLSDTDSGEICLCRENWKRK